MATASPQSRPNLNPYTSNLKLAATYGSRARSTFAVCSVRNFRHARRVPASLWASSEAAKSAALIAPALPTANVATGTPPGICAMESSESSPFSAFDSTGTWPALAASLGGVDLVNLGLGGSALLDPFTARAIRDTPADLISVKIGINLVNSDLMRLRAFTPAVHGFLDTIREGHPTTPLLVVSPLLCPIHEDTPGPSAFDLTALSTGRLAFRAAGDPAERASGKLTLNVIRDELARIVAHRAADDPNLRHLDGRDLYGAADFAELPLPDGLHPDAAAHRRIGERFAALAFGTGGLLTGRGA